MLTPRLGKLSSGALSAKLITLVNRIATTAKGWTDSTTSYEWFTKTFIPQATARRENPEEPIVLVLDGHASHKTPEMLRAALEHNIEFHFLPPHTTHRLQPLDVGIFGPLQGKWQERCDEVISETSAEIPRSQFIKEYMGVRNEVFTEELIKSAWKKAGMWPLNPKKITEKDFAPSKLMSYSASLPPGYPDLPDTPDILVFAQGSEEGEGEGNEVGADENELVDVVMGEETGHGDDIEERMSVDGEESGMETSDEGGGVDQSDGDDEMDGSDKESDRMVDEDEADDEENDGVVDADEDETTGRDEMVDFGDVSQETNALSDESCLPRYETMCYCLEQLIFMPSENSAERERG